MREFVDHSLHHVALRLPTVVIARWRESAVAAVSLVEDDIRGDLVQRRLEGVTADAETTVNLTLGAAGHNKSQP